MAKTLQEWIKTDVAKAEKMSIGQLSNQFFFRDPIRPNYIDHEHFYSPADGTILYQKFIMTLVSNDLIMIPPTETGC